MTQFRHPLWRAIERNYRAMKENAPQGYTAWVEVYLHGDPEPIGVSVVESHRDHPWILLHEYAPRDLRDDSGMDETAPSDRLIFTSEGNVARVVVGYVEKGQPPKRRFGFQLREAEEEDEPPDEG